MSLTKEQLKTLEKKLLAAKKDLENQLKKIDQGLDFGNDTDHFEEEADETEEFANRLAAQTALKEELDKINKGLIKMKEGIYGKCGRCGTKIGFKLLEIAPESELCRRCKWLSRFFKVKIK